MHLCAWIREVGVEMEDIGLVYILSERMLSEHSLLPTRETLQCALQLSHLYHNICTEEGKRLALGELDEETTNPFASPPGFGYILSLQRR